MATPSVSGRKRRRSSIMETATDYLMNVVPFAGFLLSSAKKRPRKGDDAEAQTPARNVKFSSPVVQSEVMVDRYIKHMDSQSASEGEASPKSVGSDDVCRDLFNASGSTDGGGVGDLPDLSPALNKAQTSPRRTGRAAPHVGSGQGAVLASPSTPPGSPPRTAEPALALTLAVDAAGRRVQVAAHDDDEASDGHRVDLAGWQLCVDGDAVFTFPPGTLLAAGEQVAAFAGPTAAQEVNASPSRRSAHTLALFASSEPLWAAAGSVALATPSGEVVASVGMGTGGAEDPGTPTAMQYDDGVVSWVVRSPAFYRRKQRVLPYQVASTSFDGLPVLGHSPAGRSTAALGAGSGAPESDTESEDEAFTALHGTWADHGDEEAESTTDLGRTASSAPTPRAGKAETASQAEAQQATPVNLFDSSVPLVGLSSLDLSGVGADSEEQSAPDDLDEEAAPVAGSGVSPARGPAPVASGEVASTVSYSAAQQRSPSPTPAAESGIASVNLFALPSTDPPSQPWVPHASSSAFADDSLASSSLPLQSGWTPSLLPDSGARAAPTAPATEPSSPVLDTSLASVHSLSVGGPSLLASGAKSAGRRRSGVRARYRPSRGERALLGTPAASVALSTPAQAAALQAPRSRLFSAATGGRSALMGASMAWQAAEEPHASPEADTAASADVAARVAATLADISSEVEATANVTARHSGSSGDFTSQLEAELGTQQPEATTTSPAPETQAQAQDGHSLQSATKTPKKTKSVSFAAKNQVHTLPASMSPATPDQAQSATSLLHTAGSTPFASSKSLLDTAGSTPFAPQTKSRTAASPGTPADAPSAPLIAATPAPPLVTSTAQDSTPMPGPGAEVGLLPLSANAQEDESSQYSFGSASTPARTTTVKFTFSPSAGSKASPAEQAAALALAQDEDGSEFPFSPPGTSGSAQGLAGLSTPGPAHRPTTAHAGVTPFHFSRPKATGLASLTTASSPASSRVATPHVLQAAPSTTQASSSLLMGLPTPSRAVTSTARSPASTPNSPSSSTVPPSSGGSLLGTSTSAPASGGSLFGSVGPAAASSDAAAPVSGGSLLGTSTSAPASGGSLFGSVGPAAASSDAAAPVSGGSLLGTSTSAPASGGSPPAQPIRSEVFGTIRADITGDRLKPPPRPDTGLLGSVGSPALATQRKLLLPPS